MDGSLSFDELLLRIHPAKSRVDTLALAHPARLVVFDLLVDARGRSLIERALVERRAALDAFAADFLLPNSAIRVSPATTSLSIVGKWRRSVGSGLDGLIAKRLDLPYRSGERTGMQR